MNTKVSAIIVNWNTNDNLEKLLNILQPSDKVEIIVVDNNSETPPLTLSKRHDKTTFIFNDTNKGYAAACNQGASQAKGDWLFFLNADVEIDNAGVDACVSEAIERNFDATSPLSDKEGYNKPLPSLTSLFVEFSPLRRIIPFSPFSRKTLFGGALLIKRDLFLKLKGWDERFFVWFEDSDLTKRLYNIGAHVGWLSSRVGHTGGASFTTLSKSKRSAIFFQSLSIYLKKHHGSLTQRVIGLLTERFWRGYLYSQQHEGVSLVVPNMKKNIVLEFLKQNNAYLAKLDEVIVVSSDLDVATIWSLREQYPAIRFLPIDENRGFAATVNIGMRAATGRYIGTCNDDTILNETTFSFLENLPKDAGSINPVIHKVDGSIESAGIIVLPNGKAIPLTETSTQKFQKIEATNGACVVYTRAALEKIGLFDERFGSYLEDIDLALRCTKAGLHNYVHNESHITHMQHQTSHAMGAKKQWLDFKNWILVIAKNWSSEKFVANFPSIILERLRNISGILKAL